jgi:hypothetical protein
MCRNTASGKHRSGPAEAASRESTATKAASRESTATKAARREATAAETAAAKAAAAETAAAKAAAAEAAPEGQSLGRGRRDRAAESRRGNRRDPYLPQSFLHDTTPLLRAPHGERRSGSEVSRALSESALLDHEQLIAPGSTADRVRAAVAKPRHLYASQVAA